MLEQFVDCIRIIESWRKDMESVFPYPNRKHCLVFGLEEIGEVTKAHMATFPEYLRNRVNEHDVDQEWADVLFMLGSFHLLLNGVDPASLIRYLDQDFQHEELDTLSLITVSFMGVCANLEQIMRNDLSPYEHGLDPTYLARSNADTMCTIMYNVPNWKYLLISKLNDMKVKHSP